MEQKMTKVFCHRGQPVIGELYRAAAAPMSAPASSGCAIAGLSSGARTGRSSRGGAEMTTGCAGSRPAPNKHRSTPSPGVRTQRLPRAPGRQPGADRRLLRKRPAAGRRWRLPSMSCYVHRHHRRPSRKETAHGSQAPLPRCRNGWSITPTKYLSSGGAEGHIYKDQAARLRRPRGAVAAADDDGPQVGREVHLPAVLRQDRRQLLHRRLEGRRAASIPAGTRTSSPTPRSRSRSAPTKMKARARTAGGAERAQAVGASASSSGRPTPTTRRRAEREIPVVVLDPVQ